MGNINSGIWGCIGGVVDIHSTGGRERSVVVILIRTTGISISTGQEDLCSTGTLQINIQVGS